MALIILALLFSVGNSEFFDTVKAQKAKEWKLVDTITKKSQFSEDITSLIKEFDNNSKKFKNLKGIKLNKLEKLIIDDNHIKYSTVELQIDREKNNANIIIYAPDELPPSSQEELIACGDKLWLLRCARELDDVLLYLRFNELDLGVIIFSSIGSIDNVNSHD